MYNTTILARIGAVTAAVAAPAMLFLGAGSAAAQEAPVCQDCSPITSTVGTVPSLSHPDFDWRPTAPALRPGSTRTAPAGRAAPKVRSAGPIPVCPDCTAGFEPVSF
jgi:hypothetical protein